MVLIYSFGMKNVRYLGNQNGCQNKPAVSDLQNWYPALNFIIFIAFNGSYINCGDASKYDQCLIATDGGNRPPWTTKRLPKQAFFKFVELNPNLVFHNIEYFFINCILIFVKYIYNPSVYYNPTCTALLRTSNDELQPRISAITSFGRWQHRTEPSVHVSITPDTLWNDEWINELLNLCLARQIRRPTSRRMRTGRVLT